MDRTRTLFFVIIGVAVLGIAGAALFGFINNLISDPPPIQQNGGAEKVEAPKGTFPILVASSNTKKNWLDASARQFNSENHKTSSGEIIFVEVQHVTSGGSMNGILDGKLQPAAWSPGDGSWVAQANTTWQQRHNKPLASETCAPTIYAPLGFAMWRPMAETLGWPNTPIGWDTIVDLAADPEGWAAYGRPEWGRFTFGHTHPGYANSGLLSMTAFAYGIAGDGGNLSPAEVYSDEMSEAMAALEQNTAKYGKQAPALLELMAQQGAGYLHAAAVPEADTVRFNVERGDELDFPLAFIFPSGGTIWADHPYCVLDNADWVDETTAEAAAIFRDYLLETEQQSMAIDSYLRPLDTNIALHAPLSLENGTDPAVSPETIPALPSPDAALSEAIIDQFLLSKRKASIIVVLDVSGSMEGEKLQSARAATVEFLKRLHPDDEVSVMIFSDTAVQLTELDRVGNVSEQLTGRVSTLLADGNTALFDAVCQATAIAEAAQVVDNENGQSRLYGVVLLSDGEDTIGQPSEGQMFATCLPANAEADGIKVFPIAFGDGADESVLSKIASVTGGRMYRADPGSISKAYESISAEQ